MKFGVVAIGRNEGERLSQCLSSLKMTTTPIYVDSGSSDGSVQLARGHGVDVVELDQSIPLTAARARNAGFKRVCEVAPGVRYVQFVDGDCELNERWPGQAVSFLDLNERVAIVCGRLRERHPDHSIYNWLCDQEWDGPIGEIRVCGGNAMIRSDALQAVGGFRDDLAAGEEPELCVRLRAAGWHIWRLDSEMGLHDAAMMRFSQWWQRTVRGGYAFAQGAAMHGAPERHFVWESRRALLWGLWIPLVCLMAGLTLHPWGWATWLAYPLQLLRQMWLQSGPFGQRGRLAFFQLLGRFPEAWGQIKFVVGRLLI